MCAKMPKYIELYSELRQAITRGEYPVGSFLPTENELVAKYSVSKTTVRHAVSLLKEHELVEVRQGSGTKILPMEQETVTGKKYSIPDSATSIFVQYLTQGAGEVTNTKAAIDRIPAPEAAAHALKLEPGTAVYRLQRLQLADGIVFGYMVNYISEDCAPDLISKGELLTGLYSYLSQNYGALVDHIEETVDAITAGFMEAQYLQVKAGTPLLLLRRTASGVTNGIRGPIEYCETTVRPDIFRMTVQITSGKATGAEPFL